MNKIGLFWGSNTGNQEEATNYLTDYMKSEGCEVELFNIAETPPAKMLEYKKNDVSGQIFNAGFSKENYNKVQLVNKQLLKNKI